MKILYLSLGILACGSSGRSGQNPDARGADSHSGDSGNTDNSKVYAHSGSVLYRIDTVNFGTVQIGPLTGLGSASLTDLAVDKNDHMVGVTLSKLYSIDATTGACTLISTLSNTHNPTSLSYIPSDLGDPNSADILVTADSVGDVYKIDESSGSASLIGSYGGSGATKVVSSGDLIGVRGLGIYATVDVGTGSGTNDYLARIDPTTWAATPIGTGTNYNNIFGLGFWAGTIYGFVDDKTTHTGKIIKIDPTSGVGTEILSSAIEWYGAGVTTDAPIIE